MIESKVLEKMPKKYQKITTFAEQDRFGKYHIVINHETFGEASFHDTSFSNLMYELREFCKDGSRF